MQQHYQIIQDEVMQMAKRLGILDKLEKEQHAYQHCKTADQSKATERLKRHNVLAAFVAYREDIRMACCLSLGLGTKCLSHADLLKAQALDHQRMHLTDASLATKESDQEDDRNAKTACSEAAVNTFIESSVMTQRAKRIRRMETANKPFCPKAIPTAEQYTKIRMDDLVVDMHAEVLAKRALTHLILGMQTGRVPLIPGIFEWIEQSSVAAADDDETTILTFSEEQTSKKDKASTEEATSTKEKSTESASAKEKSTESASTESTFTEAASTESTSTKEAASTEAETSKEKTMANKNHLHCNPSIQSKHITLCRNVKLFLYSSRMPCGLLSIPQLLRHQHKRIAEINGQLVRGHPSFRTSKQEQHPLITVHKDGIPCIRGHSSLEHPLAHSLPRTKPGRPDAPIAYSLSCSDKLFKWRATGKISPKWLPNFRAEIYLLVPCSASRSQQSHSNDSAHCVHSKYPWICRLDNPVRIPECLIGNDEGDESEGERKDGSVKASSICAVWSCSFGRDPRSVEYLSQGRRLGACRDAKTGAFSVKSRSLVCPWSLQQFTPSL